MAAEREERSLTRREHPALSSSPFSMMRRLSEDMERVFEDMWGARPRPHMFRGFDLAQSRWIPNIEAFERQGEFVVRADLPGMTRENVNVEEDVLVIHGERKEEKEQKEKGYYTSERSYGSFYRTIPLPPGVKSDEAKATFKDGVLEVAMPAGKVPEKHGRKVDVK